MKTVIITLSILLNLVLGILFVCGKIFQPDPRPVPANLPAQTNHAARSASNPPSLQTVLVPAPKFHWSQIESTDYLAYIENLRAIGCPEETIRDIIVADVNKLYAPRYAALAGTVPELAWWGRYDQRQPLRAELAAQLRDLHEEKKALLVRLLGPGMETERALAEESVALVRENNLFSFLPESKQTAVRRLVRHYETLLEWGEAQWRGLPSDESDALREELKANRDRELAALLTREELYEFDLRFSLTADTIRDHYGRANLTEAEFRELYERRREFERQNPEATVEDWQGLEAEYAKRLGPDRFLDLQRQNDSMWRALQEVAAESGFSDDLLGQVYAIKEEYQDRMIRSLGPFFEDPAQDPAPLRSLAAEMEEQLSALLGSQAVKRLDRLRVLPRLVVEDDGTRKMYRFSGSSAAP